MHECVVGYILVSGATPHAKSAFDVFILDVSEKKVLEIGQDVLGLVLHMDLVLGFLDEDLCDCGRVFAKSAAIHFVIIHIINFLINCNKEALSLKPAQYPF